MNFPTIERIAARDLHIDHRVQRDVQTTHVQRLVRDWNPQYAGVLIGSRRADGTVYLLDGFQRMQSRLQAGLPGYVFQVLVHRGLTLAEEAEIFLAHNRGRKNVAAYDVHHVALTLGDPVALAVDAAVRAAGFTVGRASGPRTVGCVSTMNRVVDRKTGDPANHQENLRHALVTYQSVWGATGTDFFRGEVVEALAIVYATYGDAISDRSLVHVLSRTTIAQLLAAAKTRSPGNNRVVSQVVEIIVEQYDRRKAKGRLRPAA